MSSLTQALWEIVETRRALVAPFASVVLGTNAHATHLVAHFTHCAHVAIAQCTHTFAVVAVCAHVATYTCIARSTYTLARLFVTIVVQCALTITVARLFFVLEFSH